MKTTAQQARLESSVRQAEHLLLWMPSFADRVAAIERFKDEVAAWDGQGSGPRLPRREAR
jgi:hypothetical protein